MPTSSRQILLDRMSICCLEERERERERGGGEGWGERERGRGMRKAGDSSTGPRNQIQRFQAKSNGIAKI